LLTLDLIVDNLTELELQAPELLKLFGNKRIVLIQGEMGAGKTTLVKQLCAALGIAKDEIHSPTFSIVNEYQNTAGNSVYHFDLYRINKREELNEIGFGEYLHSGSYCFIEWPEMIREDLADIPHAEVNLSVLEQDKRLLQLSFK
jgi:tRNA threonylcarbamoyladenosine biosynthesis protein TsaE